MIHTVYFWLKKNLSDEDVQKFESCGKELLQIDVIQKGILSKPADTPERPVTNNDFSYSLHLTFSSVEDHNTYQDHPDHEVFVKTFSPWFATASTGGCDTRRKSACN